MHKIALSLAILVATFILSAASVQAQAVRTFVAAGGDDNNPCSRLSPCRNFVTALSRTTPGGVINCIDVGAFGDLTITRAITIDCTGTYAGITGNAVTAITVNVGANDVVTLRGLDIAGVGTGLTGINFISGGVLRVSHSKVHGFRSGSATGINLATPNGAASELYVSDTIISDNGSSATNGAVVVRAAGSGSAKVSLNRVHLDNNSAGLRVDGASSTGGLNVVMRDSTAGGNTNSGITALSLSGAIIFLMLDNVAAINNATGVVANGANTRVLITRLTASGNATGVDAPNSGIMNSYLDNHINGNTANGVPTGTITPQ